MSLPSGPVRRGSRFSGVPGTGSPGQPLVTVVIVVLNGEQTVERCLRSLLRHSSASIEIVVIDGGSTDGTLDVIRRYEDRIDHWISEPDKGIYDAMNKGVRLSRGDWIYFLGADDVLCCDIESLAARFRDSETLYYGNVLLQRANVLYDGPFTPFKLSRRNICQQAIFYPRSVFRKYEFESRYPLLADWHLNMRCHKDAGIKLCFIPVTVALYNDASGISSTARDTAFYEEYLHLARSFFPFWIYAWLRIERTAVSYLERIGLSGFAERIYLRFSRNPLK